MSIATAPQGSSRASLLLKRGTCYASLDEWGFVTQATDSLTGVFLHDTRHLSLWRWDLPGFKLLQQSTSSNTLVQHWSRFVDHAQDILIRRQLKLEPDGLRDTFVVISEALSPTRFSLRLDVDADFQDLLELRGFRRSVARHEPEKHDEDGVRVNRYRARDGVESVTRTAVQGLPDDGQIHLDPGQTLTVEAFAKFSTELGEPVGETTLAWTGEARSIRNRDDGALAQAFNDIDTLTSPSDFGPLVMTGIPNFVAVFGRDGLITARFLLDAAPEYAVTILRVLAAHQGKVHDPFNEEHPDGLCMSSASASLHERAMFHTDATAVRTIPTHSSFGC